MSSSRSGNAVILIAVIAVIAGAALIGYSSVSESNEKSIQLHAHKNAAAEHTHEDSAESHAHDAPKEASATAEAPTPEAAPKTIDLSGLAPHAMDVVIGNHNAPIRIVEYASLSCPHCARMHMEILPPIKDEFVKTEKAYIAYRHFPLNAPALKAAVAVSCTPMAQRADLLNALFANQRAWAFDNGYTDNIAAIATEFGVSKEELEKCNEDVALENKLLQIRQVGEMAGVQSTPTLFVNGNILEGAVDTQTIRAAITEAQTAGDNAKEIPQE